MHKMEFGDRIGDRAFGIMDYLVVYPFSFIADEQLEMSRPCALFRLGGSGFTTDAGREQQTRHLPGEPSDFSIRHGSEVVLRLLDFRAHFAVAAASLDMSALTWVLVGEKQRGTVEFSPAEQRFPLFGVSEGAHSFWGAKLQERATDEVVLKASLSVPTYVLHSGARYVAEYLALGPANASGGRDRIGSMPSVFSWVVGQAGRRIRTLEVADLTTGQSDFFFGEDERDQVEHAKGAVFVMNGTMLKTPWRQLVGAIRATPSGKERWDPKTREFAQWIEMFPLGAGDETIEETMSRESATAEPAAVEADFEGIMLWNLDRRSSGDAEAAAMHG